MITQKRLKELLDYEPVDIVMQTLDDCSKVQDSNEKLAIIKEAGFTGEKHFFCEDTVKDDEAIQKMLDKLEKEKPVPEPSPAPVPDTPAEPEVTVEAPEPMPEPAPEPAPEPDKLTFDFNTLASDTYKELVDYTTYYPLYHIYYALEGEDDKKYNERDRHQVFDGKSRDELMADIDSIMGTGMAKNFQAAAQAGEDFKTAFIEAIACNDNLRNYSDLINRLNEIRDKFVELYSIRLTVK